jgi:hypothetical protein
LASPVETIGRLKGQIGKTLEGDGNPYALARSAASVVGAATGLPSGQINATLTGVEEWDEADSELEAFYRLFVRRPYNDKK